MIGPYWMVAVNVITSGLLFGGIFIYRFVFPKRKINLLLLLIIVSILPLISITRSGSYESGDLSLHVTQAMSFYSSLREGVLFPLWGGDLNATYGYPAFMFIYPLPYYLIAIFHFVGFSFLSSVKLLLVLSYVSSGIFTFFWIKNDFGEKTAFIASIFYLFFPYHLVDLHFRADIGEVLAFAIIPLNFYLISKFIKQPTFVTFALESFAFGALIMSHPAISIAAVPFSFAYLIFLKFKNTVKTKKIIMSFLAVISGIMLTAFYWMPTIYNIRYVYQSLFSNAISFVTVSQLIYSPWRFGFLFQGPKGELSFAIGYLQLFIVGLSFYFLIKNKFKRQEKNIIVFSLIMFFLLIVFMLQISQPLWQIMPLFKNFQFTYRLLIFEALITSTIAGITIAKFKNNYIIYIFIILVITQTILNWGNRKTLPSVNDNYLASEIKFSNAFPQAVPIWVNKQNFWMTNVPKQHLEVLAGNATVKQVLRSSILHEYIVAANTQSYLKENTLFFPGWNIYANGERLKANYQNPKFPGIITFNLPKGNYSLKLAFENTTVVSVSEWISVLTLIGMGILMSLKLLRPKL